MSKTYKTRIEKKEYVHNDIESITCDLCGKTTTNQWRPNMHDVVEIECRLNEGKQYIEGTGQGEEIIVDLCPACFKEKLLPWLKTQGVNPLIREWKE